MSGDFAFRWLGAWIVGLCGSVAVVHLAQREVGWLPFLTSLLGFVLSFGIIALVPYDVWEALTLAGAKETGQEPRTQVLAGASWELIYWVTFLLCWLLCPVLIEYESAGDFTMLRRLRASLRRNAARCAGYSVVGLLLLVCLSVAGGARGGLGAWCIAASNAWGLLASTVLMGYGLVAVPRHFWRLANPGQQLTANYCVAVSMDEARLSTQFELQDVISEARAEIASRSMQMWDPMMERAFSILQQTLEECEQLYCELTNGARGNLRNFAAPEQSRACGAVPRGGEDANRLECLAQLHGALKQAALEARRSACRWDELVQRCLLLEDLEEQIYPSAVELATTWQSSPFARLLCRWHLVRSCWHGSVLLWLGSLRPRVLRAMAGICGVLSTVIVLGQFTMFSGGRSLSLLSLLFKEGHGFAPTQVFCILPLSYMVYTAYWSVFRLKMAGWYGLYWNHNTDAGNLLWCASVLARLAAPLCYHFLLLVKVKGTAFQELMGQMDVVPVLGRSFNEIFPMLVGFLCICNLLNVYSRLVQFCGFDAFEFEWAPPTSADAGDLLAEGKKLVGRERSRRSEDRNLLELHDRNESRHTIPLRCRIAQLIEEGTLPCDWNAHST